MMLMKTTELCDAGLDAQGAGRARAARRRGFSLVELISVFLIISLLIALSISVGRSVLQGRGERATQNVIQILDQALSTYISVKNAKPPAFYTDRAGTQFPVIDGDISGVPVPSTALFILQLQEVPEAKALLTKIPSQFIRRRVLTMAGEVVQVGSAGGPGSGGQGDNLALVIVDAWGQPIRYVHPEFHGSIGANGTGRSIQVGTANAVFTRLVSATFPNVVDSDEGYCVNNRPYFYSAGPDTTAGTRKDNLYSSRPTFQAETTQQVRPGQ
jgi:type II secretory pathway pseudopilin PulG